MPATDFGGVVAGVAVSGRVVNSDDGHLGGVSIHNELSELEQVGLDFAFVEGKHGISTLKRTDGFEGDVLRITCTYSYYSYVAHLVFSSIRKTCLSEAGSLCIRRRRRGTGQRVR